MKKIRLLFTSALLCGLVTTGWGQTTLNKGDIALVGMSTGGEDFAFVTFVNLAAGTQIYFTDEEADNDLTIGTGEGTLLYTAPAGGVTAGTVITGSTTPAGDFTGTSDGNPALANGGDGIIAYQGSSVGTVTTFLHFIGENASRAGTFPANTLGASDILLMGDDDGNYTGTTSGTASALFTAINTVSNWTVGGSLSLNAPASFTIQSATPPDITIADANQPSAGNINQGAQDAVIAGVSAAVTTANATLNTFDVTINGTFDSDDVDNFQLFYSTTNSFGSAAQIGSNIAGNGNGTSQALSFTSLSQSINDGVTGYFWVVADVSATATAGNTLNADAPVLTFASGNITNNATNAASGMQTIQSVTPAVTLADNGTQITAANVAEATDNHVLSSFELAVTTANADLNGLNITTAGTYLAADVNDLQLWFSSDNTFNAGSDQSLVTIAAPATAGAQNFTGFNQIINSGSTGYFFITVDVACPATDGNTISVNGIANSDLSFNGTVTRSGSASAAGTQTIQDATPADVTGLSATAGNTQATVSWTNPTCFDEVIIVAHTSSIGGTPTGTYTASSQDFTDVNNPNFPGGGKVVFNGSASPQTITGLTNGTQYFFKVFARNGSNWSTPGVEVNATPSNIQEPNAGDLIITEIAGDDVDGNSGNNNPLMEIYNTTANTINLANVEVRYYNSNPGGVSSFITLSGTILANGFVTVSQDAAAFNTQYGSNPDFTGSSFFFNGGDDGVDINHTTNGVIDQFNDNGSGQSPFTWNDGSVYERNSTASGALLTSWSEYAAGTGTPAQFLDANWTGNTDNDWNTASNWTEVVPAEFQNANLPASATVTVGQNNTVNNLTLEPGATLTISSGQTLTVNGNATLNADATGYAQVIGDVSGTVAVESYLTAGSARWFNVANPHAGGTVADFGVSDGSIITSASGTAGQVNIWYYDPATLDGTTNEGTWTRVPNTAESTDGKAFSLFLGPPHFGTFPITVTATGSSLANGSRNVVLDNSNGGWNFVPNPYPSALDWNSYRDANTTNLNATYYVDNAGTFASYDASADAAANGGDPFVAPMQGFFVQATGAATLAFTNTHRSVANSPNKLKSSATLVKLKSSSMATQGSDESVIVFGNQYSDGLDVNLDAEKRMNYATGVPNLFTTDSLGHQFVYNKLNNQFTEKVVALSFENDTAGLHSIDISDNRLPADWSVTLVDKLNGNRFDLLSGSYQFTHNTGNRADRFDLIFKQQVVGEEEARTANIYAYLLNDELAVNLENWSGQATVSVYDMQGRLISTGHAEGGSTFRSDLSGLASGLYLVKVTAGERPLHTQKIIK